MKTTKQPASRLTKAIVLSQISSLLWTGAYLTKDRIPTLPSILAISGAIAAIFSLYQLYKGEQQ